jgi:hypothetical protein
MKTLISILIVLSSCVALGEESSQPTKVEEPMRCYPMALVKKWAKAKHKRRPCPTPAPIVIEKPIDRPVYVDREVIVERTVVKEAPKNNLSLLGGRTETGINVTQSTYPNLQAQTAGQLDIGAMYQRRLTDHWRASVIGTKNGSFYGGIGYDF